MDDRTLLKDHNGTQIFVDADGRFSAELDGKTVTKRTLSELTRAIDGNAAKEPLAAWRLHPLPEYRLAELPQRVAIVGTRKTGRYERRLVKADGKVAERYDSIYLADEATVARLTEIVQQIRDLWIEGGTLIRGMRELTPERFDRIAKGQETPT